MNKKIEIHQDNPCRERGQSLVEMAMSLVILLLLVGGVVDFGRAFFTFMALRDAVQEGALYGSINPALTQEIRNHVLDSSDMIPDLINEVKQRIKSFVAQYDDIVLCYLSFSKKTSGLDPRMNWSI